MSIHYWKPISYINITQIRTYFGASASLTNYKGFLPPKHEDAA